jgi:glyoxylase-like metal-dependent hydrolase (beta-lactamase superfamily II)
MTISRRTFIAAGAAALAAPRWSVADTQIGGLTLQTVSDGSLMLPGDFIFAPVPADVAGPVRAAYGLEGDTLTPPCNVTLLRGEGRVILFDAGSGPAFQPSAGSLLDALDAAGVAPEDVTHVVFTHGHPDHLWGCLDDFDEPVFAEAEHLMGQLEFEYWTDPATVDSIGAERQAFAVGAARRLETIADRMTFFEDGAEVLPGITAVHTPGHTPGHMSFALSSGGDSALILGDAIGNHHISFAHPGVTVGSDQDMAQAAATRLRLFDRLTADDMRLVGFHLPEGGIGRAERSGDGYRFVAEA